MRHPRPKLNRAYVVLRVGCGDGYLEISNPCEYACNYCRLPTEDTHSSRGLQGLVFFVLLEISFSRCTRRSGRFRFRLGMRVNVYVVTKTFSITQCRPYNTAKVCALKACIPHAKNPIHSHTYIHTYIHRFIHYSAYVVPFSRPLMGNFPTPWMASTRPLPSRTPSQ